ncbi:branched-chain amino acid ABC transporter permease [Thermanaeromonas toyohensis]|uniref:branched-chain amino acid ABC transporter permease n=1 Tax=Thermanaeromonas toyohensis TaxID=161154 RepID=UPI001E4E8586|nr:branched-chain amino acid ABC transporter permease [Thermanaeromonas toyohensis]
MVTTLPLVLESEYLLLVTDMGAAIALVVLGLVVLTGFTGLLSLGQVAFYALGAYTSAVLSTRLGISPWIGLLAACVMGGIWGIIIGLPAFNLREPFLVMVTIGFAEIVRIMALNLQSITGGPFGISHIPQLELLGVSISKPLLFYYFILTLVTLCILGVNRLRSSRIGRAMVAIRDDEVAAEIMGVNVRRYKVMSFAISALLASLGGAFYAHLTSYIVIDLFSFNESASYLTMAVLGGFNTIGSALVSVVLTLLPELLRALKDYYMLFFSLVLMILVVFVAWREFKASMDK